MTSITHENLPELVTRELSNKIIRNELKPGERIFEAKIAQELGVSRSPVREALRILERNRLVEMIPRKGVRVTKITAQHIKWFYDIFEALYGLVARKAAENADSEDIGNMSVALKKIENAAEKGDIESYFINIFEYASVGMKAARNPLLEQLIIELWPSSRRIQFSSLLFRADDLKKNVTYFQRCSKYVEQGNALMAEKVIQEYARNEEAFALKIVNGDKK
ncbi:MAG: GntR family transcriptional regulator [Deltaproteobacteria bacterium]|nr:GntR family transcriptional regulator [Deltaproteobacteria bacterium]